jgi:hypothetical protein
MLMLTTYHYLLSTSAGCQISKVAWNSPSAVLDALARNLFPLDAQLRINTSDPGARRMYVATQQLDMAIQICVSYVSCCASGLLSHLAPQLATISCRENKHIVATAIHYLISGTHD